MTMRTPQELRDAADEFRRLATLGIVEALRVALQRLADEFEEEAGVG